MNLKQTIRKILKEEFDPNDLGWADEVGELPINVGDVFYIVDNGDDTPPFRDDYKPNNVRYVLVITDIKDSNGKIVVGKKLCPHINVSYNPKDYTIEKCRNYSNDERGGEDSYLELNRATDLINRKYWRYMGNSEH